MLTDAEILTFLQGGHFSHESEGMYFPKCPEVPSKVLLSIHDGAGAVLTGAGLSYDYALTVDLPFEVGKRKGLYVWRGVVKTHECYTVDSVYPDVSEWLEGTFRRPTAHELRLQDMGDLEAYWWQEHVRAARNWVCRCGKTMLEHTYVPAPTGPHPTHDLPWYDKDKTFHVFYPCD